MSSVSDASVVSFLEANRFDAGKVQCRIGAEATNDRVGVGCCREFLSNASANGHRVALVTSGGTSVPLEQNPVRFIANFSTGGRGSRLAEELLSRGFAVLFLSRRGSLQPFHRVVQAEPAPLDALRSKAHEVEAAKQALQHHGARLLTVSFDSVVEYLGLLRLLSLELSRGGVSVGGTQRPPPVVLLAAAVSDYYVPWDQMPEHKMSGAREDGSIQLTLQQVPKCLGLLRKEWLPPAVRVLSFKLETDREALQRKALANLKLMWTGDLVVGNLLQSYNSTATVYRSTAEEGEVKENANWFEERKLEDAPLERGVVEALLLVAV